MIMYEQRRLNSESTDTSTDTYVTNISGNSTPTHGYDTESKCCMCTRTQDQSQDFQNAKNFRECHYNHSNKRVSRTRTGLTSNRCSIRNDKIKCAMVILISVCISMSIHIPLILSRTNSESPPSQAPGPTTVSPEMQQDIEKKRRLCFNCHMLEAYIDKWAWNNDVTQDIIYDECCFNDYLTLLRTFKFYADVKVSQMKADLSRTTHDMRELHNAIRNISVAAQNGTNGTITPQIIYRIPDEVMDMMGAITQKKRSILYLKSNGTFGANHMSLMRWSSDTMYYPYIMQGNYQLQRRNTQITNMDTGYYTIRVEIMFKANVQTNETIRAELLFYIKSRNGGRLTTIETFRQTFTFSDANTEYKGVVHKIVKLQDARIEIHVPRDNNFVSRDPGAHSISIIEES